MLTLLALFAAPAAAETPVLVSALQPRSPEAKKVASLLEGYLADKLSETEGVQVVRIEQTPKFQDYDARIYIDSCPPGQIVGCSLILAERGETEWAVTGSVRALPDRTEVEIAIVNVEESRVAVSFTSEIESGRDDEFAEGVAKVLVAAIKGEIGKEEDIRSSDDGSTKRSAEETAAIAKELESLQAELGGVTTTFSRSGEGIERPTYTFEDLAEQMQTDASKPWENLGMTPGEYLRYKNSGMQLLEWRKRILGRQGELVLRVGGGVSHAPVDAQWYGRVQLDDITLATIDAYGAQGPQTGTGAIFGGAIGFGVLPFLEISAQGGVTSGTFVARIGDPEKDGDVAVTKDFEFDNWSTWASARANLVLLPAQMAHPIIGVGGMWMRGTSVEQHTDVLTSDYYSALVVDGTTTTFPAQNLIFAEVVVGGELRLSNNVDIFLHVPMDLLLYGGEPQVVRVGSGAVLDGLTPPSAASMFAVGAQAGLQVRLGGAKPKETSRLDEMDE